MKRIIIFAILLGCTAIFSQTPTFEFVTDPTNIGISYYDYMPAGYNALPIQVEEEGSVYLVFHGREMSASTRRVYYSFINSTGVVEASATLATNDIHEGFPSIDLDLISGDPFVAWHGNYNTTTADLDVIMSYDQYHLGAPGLWITPFIVFDDDTPSANMPQDEFIWPEVHIGPSPIPDKRRIYVIGYNSDPCPANGNPSENVLIGYADFDSDDLLVQSNLEWTYRTIELLDEWHNGNPEWVRPYLSCAVSDDGQIAFMGHIAFSSQSANFTDQIILFYNDNFGEGEFNFYSQEAHHNVWYPMADNWYFAPYRCYHKNVIFHDNKISFLGSMSLLIDPVGVWFTDVPAVYPKVFSFDTINNEFSFYDLYIEGANPTDDTPMLPWDLDEDGIIDSVNANGEPVWPECWPFFYYDYASALDMNLFKITKNEENGWLAAIWSDGLKARYAEEDVPGYEDWLEVPEIAISISNNNGETWSQPIFLNANETPELADMIPCYIYPGDKIEDLGNDHGKLHLMFLDDSEFGQNSSVGLLKYCSIEIDFGSITGIGEEVISTSPIHLTNFPNPFNPSTTISFDLTTEITEDTELVIYNLKGQKVRQFTFPNGSLGTSEQNHQISQSPNHQIVWNGSDESGKSVSTGVYFAKLITGNRSATRKMLLLK